MKSSPNLRGTFEKVGECLYRYSTNGVYYALLKRDRKQTRKSLGTTDRTLARRLLAALRQRPTPGPSPAVGRRSLRHYADLYLETCGWQKPASLSQKKRLHRNFIRDWPGDVDAPVERVGAAEVARWLAGYAEAGSSWHNLHLSFVRAALALAVEDHAVEVNPASAIKRRRKKTPVRVTPTPQQFAALLADIRAHALRTRDRDAADLLEFIGLAGLGNIEAASLTWGDVDFETGRIATYRHKTSTPFTIPIYPRLRPLLERLRAERGGSPARTERIFRVFSVRGALISACRRLDHPAFSHRAFRRMFITDALQRGVDVQVIAGWQGHRDGGKLILDTYSRVVEAHSHEMAKRMT